ncbi:hypothetical protein EJB05_30540, partial [Eragrostis curvula]
MYNARLFPVYVRVFFHFAPQFTRETERASSREATPSSRAPRRRRRSPVPASLRRQPPTVLTGAGVGFAEMSTPAAARNKKGAAASAAFASAAATPARNLGRGVHPTAMASSLSQGGGSAAPPRSLVRGGGSAAAAACGGGFDGSSSSMEEFPISLFDGSSAWFDAASGDPSSPGSWDIQNSHLVGAAYHSSPPNQAHNASSPPEVEMRTEKRIMWTVEEDVRLMSAWVENSTNSSCGADRAGNQYWSDVVEYYNRTTPPLRKTNLKQCKDRWHKINRWTDLFECAYVKACRVFTSGYLDQMWIDAAHKFYVDDNKDANLGPFLLTEVWKQCRDEPKWKTYNEDLKNARKRKSFHLEGDSQEDDEAVPDEMPQRPIGQKAAKKAALAAKGKNKDASDESGNSKEDKFDKFSKFQEENHDKRLQILEVQQKLSSE